MTLAATRANLKENFEPVTFGVTLTTVTLRQQFCSESDKPLAGNPNAQDFPLKTGNRTVVTEIVQFGPHFAHRRAIRHFTNQLEIGVEVSRVPSPTQSSQMNGVGVKTSPQHFLLESLGRNVELFTIQLSKCFHAQDSVTTPKDRYSFNNMEHP